LGNAQQGRQALTAAARAVSHDDYLCSSNGKTDHHNDLRYGATSAIFRSSPLDRAMRDIMIVCQHRVVHLKMYRPAGRLLLGLESEEALF
jgi:hypothetical protein